MDSLNSVTPDANGMQQPREKDSRFYCGSVTLKDIHVKSLLEYLKLCEQSTPGFTYPKTLFEGIPKLYRSDTLEPEENETWQKLLGIRRLSGVSFLCLKKNGRVILPEELHKYVIEQAHRGVNLFQHFVGICDWQPCHNDYDKTKSLLKREYAVGRYEFGIRKSAILTCVNGCQECKQFIDPTNAELPIEPINEEKTKSARNSSNNSLAKSGPISQLWDNEKQESIWYNKNVLAKEKNMYTKLIGVIREIGLETHLAIDCDEKAIELLALKILCAKQMVIILKSKYKDKMQDFYNYPDAIHDQLQTFKDSYLDIERLDTFLYDINMLLYPHATKIYNTNARRTWLNLVNDFVDTFTSQTHREDHPIDFNVPIILDKFDVQPIEPFLCVQEDRVTHFENSASRDGDTYVTL